MKILLITFSYPPEVRSASHLMYELACELRDRGDEVTVLTTTPQYNIPDDKKDFSVKGVVDENGVRVLRTRTLPVKKVGFVLRGIGILALPMFFLRYARKHLKQIDIVVVYSPPLTLAILGCLLKWRNKCKFILNLQDIFPQNAIDLRILQNKLLIFLFEFIERQSYKYADHITVHSEGNRKLLVLQKGVAKDKVSIIHNWVDKKEFEKTKQTGFYKTKYGLDGKFVILFAGVVGPAQGLDIIIPIAEILKETPDIVFLIVGDGIERPKIEQKARKRDLQSIKFTGFVSNEEYLQLAKEMDVGLVCLSQEMKTPVVPSKIQGYMAASLPIIGILNKESDGHKLIHDAGAGISVETGDVDKCSKAIYKLYHDKDLRKKMGEAGKLYADSNFAKTICIDSLYRIFNKL